MPRAKKCPQRAATKHVDELRDVFRQSQVGHLHVQEFFARISVVALRRRIHFEYLVSRTIEHPDRVGALCEEKLEPGLCYSHFFRGDGKPMLRDCESRTVADER